MKLRRYVYFGLQYSFFRHLWYHVTDSVVSSGCAKRGLIMIYPEDTVCRRSRSKSGPYFSSLVRIKPPTKRLSRSYKSLCTAAECGSLSSVLLLDRPRRPSFRFTAGTSTVSKYYSKARFAFSPSLSRSPASPVSSLGRSSDQNPT